jgi:hypothetical protein
MLGGVFARFGSPVQTERYPELLTLGVNRAFRWGKYFYGGGL